MKLNFFYGKTTAQILSVFDGMVDELNARIAKLTEREAVNNSAIVNLRIENDMISEECDQASLAISRIKQITGKE